MISQLFELTFDAAFAVYWLSKKTCKSIYYLIYPENNPVLPEQYSLNQEQLNLILEKLNKIESDLENSRNF